MITQLQLLEQAINELKERYHITASELLSLKNKMSHDTSAQDVSILQSELQTAKETIEHLTQTNANLETQIVDLQEQNQILFTQNQELTEKNNLAISRAEVIQNWLAEIDRVD